MWAEEPETPEEWMMRKEALSLSRKVFDAMSERDAGVTLRVANGDTYEAVGAVYGISRERTRQLAELGGRKLHDVHCRHGSWVDPRDAKLVEPCAVSELELEPLPDALCTRCKAPFKAAHSARRWCNACRSMRHKERVRQVYRYPTMAECEDCGTTRTVASGVAGKRCRPCYMAWLNGVRDRSRDTVRRGEGHPGAKLTDDDVRHIRRLYSRGASIKKIARDIGHSYWTVHCVAKGRTWTHVGEDST